MNYYGTRMVGMLFHLCFHFPDRGQTTACTPNERLPICAPRVRERNSASGHRVACRNPLVPVRPSSIGNRLPLPNLLIVLDQTGEFITGNNLHPADTVTLVYSSFFEVLGEGEYFHAFFAQSANVLVWLCRMID